MRRKPDAAGTDPARDGVRLDVWLDVSCLFKTRSEAKRACEGGKVDVNGQPGTSHRLVRPGDELRISRPHGRRQLVTIVTVAERSLPRADARLLYEDKTPPPTPEELDARRAERLFRALTPPGRAPSKKDRREIRKLRGR